MNSFLQIKDLTKTYQKEDGTSLDALQALNLDLDSSNHLISLIGPDGSGKSTFLKILAGIENPSQGTLNLNLKDYTCGYMSQNLGLYEDISVINNLKTFSKLRDVQLAKFNQNSKQNLQNLDELYDYYLTRAGLIKFKDYKAGSLSGGMKQKLALTCAICAQPKLLLLDEPTVGVDPISRRELWQIITDYLQESNSYCIFSSLYLEEAEKGDYTIFINQGHTIYTGTSATLKQQVNKQCFVLNLHNHSTQKIARVLMCHLAASKCIEDICPRLGNIDLLTYNFVTYEQLQADIANLFIFLEPLIGKIGAQDFSITKREPILEDAYIKLTDPNNSLTVEQINTKAQQAQATFQEQIKIEADEQKARENEAKDQEEHHQRQAIIDVHKIKKQFGNFTAVHDSSFKVYKGEIFGLLGPNGAGKTTTFRMICALLNPSTGKILINNMSLMHAKSSVRSEIGYVAQKFCLYRKLTLLQNMQYFGTSYGLKGTKLDKRIKELCESFHLTPFLNDISSTLPFGIQRLLSMACALIHKPKILFLDEATSGADPTSRRSFWAMIAQQASLGTTIIVTTHFMEEAEYCDRFLIQDQGKILILGSPDEICTKNEKRISVEEAFIDCVIKQRQQNKA